MKESYRQKIGRFFFKEEGGKKVLNKKRATIAGILVLAIGIMASLVPDLFGKREDSQITKSDVPILKDETTPPDAAAQEAAKLGGVSDHAPVEKVAGSSRGIAIKYKGKQVIGPDDGSDRIPRGANFIGKLVSGIDTRSPQTVQVTLPYGGSSKNGGSLPPETILFGQASYPGQGDRVYVQFDHGLLPGGQEVNIQAQALNSKDYTAGIFGDFHGNTGNRIASVLGLSMVGGISEVMVEKEALGNTYMATPKSSLKNGLYNGLAKVTETEANIQAEKLSQTPEYVTVNAGSDLIISLTKSFGSTEGER